MGPCSYIFIAMVLVAIAVYGVVARKYGSGATFITISRSVQRRPTRQAKVRQQPPARPADGQAAPGEQAKLECIVVFGLALAKADGRVAQAEKKCIRAYLAERFGVDAVMIDALW